jgi:DNA-binding response OmpR family regulator
MPKSVLIVEDDLYIRDNLKIILEAESYKVVLAIHGQDAFERLAEMQEAPGLIILDLMMPVMNGIEFLDRLKTHTFASTPVVVISAAPLSNPKGLSIKSLVSNVISKPFDVAHLIETVETFCLP